MKPTHWFDAAAPLLVSASLLTSVTAFAAAPAPAPATPPQAAGAPSTPPPAAAPAATTGTPAAAPAPAKPLPPPPPPPPPAQIDFEAARDLVVHKKYDKALKALEPLPDEDGYTPTLANQVRLLRAEILLAQRRPDKEQAQPLVLRVLHEDREGKTLADAGDSVKSLANDLRDSHVFVLHELLPITRPGRPVKFKVKVTDPRNEVVSLKLHLSPHGVASFTETEMKRDAAGWSFRLKEPESLAPDGVTDDYVIDYFFTGHDASGAVLDSDGSADEPLQTLFSNVKSRSVEVAEGVDLNAVTRAEEAPPVVVLPPAETPWYARWYSITAESVVGAAIIATVVSISVEATRPAPALPAHLATVSFPVTK